MSGTRLDEGGATGLSGAWWTAAGVLSAGTISNLVARLDTEIESFRNRPIRRGYRYVYLDGKHGKISRPRRYERGRGRSRKAVLLLAWGIRHDGSEELIGYQVAHDESEASWEAFSTPCASAA